MDKLRPEKRNLMGTLNGKVSPSSTSMVNGGY